MGAAAAETGHADAAARSGRDGKKKGGKKTLILAAAAVTLILAGAGLWFTGVLPGLLGKTHEAPPEQKEAARPVPVFVDLPEMVANLNTGGHRASYVKLKARVELSKPADQASFMAALPRVVDLFQTYLREMRPEELRGSAGTYRLREELIARATLATAPAQVVDVLFSELLVQ